MIKKTKYDKFIIQELDDKKVKVSAELCQLLESKFSIKKDNARQIIKRTAKKGFIKSSKPLTFGKGRFAYSLPNTKLTKDRIKIICKKYRPTLYRLLVSIDINDGIISYYEALKITSSPIIESTTKVDHLNDLINLLQNFDLVYQKKDNNLVRYIILKNKQDDEEKLMNSHFAKMSVDTAFVKDIIDWIVKSNLIDNKNIVYRNKNKPSKGAKHNNLIWDAFGYTKTTGINPNLAKNADTKEKQTLVVFDIVISRDYHQIDLDGFLNRIQINLHSVKTGNRKVIPIIVYKNCEQLTLNKIKRLGFLSYDIGSIYGSNIFSVLENISKIQINKKILENNNFEKIIEETLETIDTSGQNDQLKALKGTLFEVLLYQILKHQYPNAEIIPNQQYSKEVTDKKTKVKKSVSYEYDYIIKSSHPREIIIVEAKGYKSNYEIPLGDYQTKNTIGWFFKKTQPFIREKYKREIGEGYILKGCYITSSKISDDAIKDLKTLSKGSLKPNNLDMFYNRERLLKLLSDKGFKNLKRIIEKFY